MTRDGWEWGRVQDKVQMSARMGCLTLGQEGLCSLKMTAPVAMCKS
jgi:hypothetical protein